MISYLRHNEIDKQQWDECVEKAFNGIIYAYSWYLDVVCTNWEALVEDDYKTIMPLITGKKFGIDYLYPPYFAQQLGVFSVRVLTEQKVTDFFDAVPEKFKRIEVNLNAFNKFQEHAAFKVKSLHTHELELIQSYEYLSEHYTESTQRNIKKFLKSHLEIFQGAALKEVLSIFRDNIGKNIPDLKDIHYSRFYDAVNLCIRKQKGLVLGVKQKNGKLCAGAVFIFSHGKIFYILSASTEEGKQNGAEYYLMDRFIFENAQRNLVLDFNDGNHPFLDEFFKGFGSRESSYLQVTKNDLPSIFKWIKN